MVLFSDCGHTGVAARRNRPTRRSERARKIDAMLQELKPLVDAAIEQKKIAAEKKAAEDKKKAADLKATMDELKIKN